MLDFLIGQWQFFRWRIEVGEGTFIQCGVNMSAPSLLVPSQSAAKWQGIVDLLAEIMHVEIR